MFTSHPRAIMAPDRPGRQRPASRTPRRCLDFCRDLECSYSNRHCRRCGRRRGHSDMGRPAERIKDERERSDGDAGPGRTVG